MVKLAINGAKPVVPEGLQKPWPQIFRIESDGLPVFLGPTQTTVGSAGVADALPSNPAKYIEFEDSSETRYLIPCYNKN
jgi:hypothetical protein